MSATVFHYKTIESPTESLFRDRGSKFLGFAFPFNATEDLRKLLQPLKEAHPKAVHFCYAYRIGTDGTQYRANDDGEPSGSAGKPILGAIDSLELTNVIVVIVRYFGGTLLGVPGLINAYKTTSLDALNAATVVEKAIEKLHELEFPYDIMNDVMMVLKQHKVNIIVQEMLLFCRFKIGIPLTDYDICIQKLKNIYRLEIK